MYTYESYLGKVEEVLPINLFIDRLGQILFFASVIFFVVGFLLFAFKKNLEAYARAFSNIFAVFIFIFGLWCCFQSVKLQKEIKADFKENVPMVWKLEKEEVLCNLTTSDNQIIDENTDLFVSKVKTNNIIDYEYVVKTDTGFQLLRLSNSVNGYKEKEVFLKEDNKKKPTLAIERKTYEDERFKKIFRENFLFSILVEQEPRRCIFTVPVGTVKTEFNYN